MGYIYGIHIYRIYTWDMYIYSAHRNTLPPKWLIFMSAYFQEKFGAVVIPTGGRTTVFHWEGGRRTSLSTPSWWENYSIPLGGRQAHPSKILDGSLRLLALERSRAPPHLILVL